MAGSAGRATEVSVKLAAGGVKGPPRIIYSYAYFVYGASGHAGCVLRGNLYRAGPASRSDPFRIKQASSVTGGRSYAQGDENNLDQSDGVYYLGPGYTPGYGVLNHAERVVSVARPGRRSAYDHLSLAEPSGRSPCERRPCYTSKKSAWRHLLTRSNRSRSSSAV